MTLEELQKLCDGATSGPWTAEEQSHAPSVCIQDAYGDKLSFVLDGHNPAVWQCDDEQDGCPDLAREWMATAQFIAAARAALPRLIAAVKASKAYLAGADDCYCDEPGECSPCRDLRAVAEIAISKAEAP